MEDRREDRKSETNGPAPPWKPWKPDPAPVPPKETGPIFWISREPVSEVPPVHGPTPRWR